MQFGPQNRLIKFFLKLLVCLFIQIIKHLASNYGYMMFFIPHSLSTSSRGLCSYFVTIYFTSKCVAGGGGHYSEKTTWLFSEIIKSQIVFHQGTTLLHIARLDHLRHATDATSRHARTMPAVGRLIKLYFAIGSRNRGMHAILAQNLHIITRARTLKRHCLLFRRKRRSDWDKGISSCATGATPQWTDARISLVTSPGQFKWDLWYSRTQHDSPHQINRSSRCGAGESGVAVQH